MLSKSYFRAIAYLALFASSLFFGAAHSQTKEKAISVTFLDRNGNEIGKRGVPGESVTAAERILAPFRCTTPRTVHIKKTCSMALGDQGITPLAHTAGYAQLANGGKSIKPFAIVELRNTDGTVLYDDKRDSPPQQQLFNPKAVAMLNGMLEKVVSEGTGKAAMLDFTTAAGKTGTSSAYKDAWFIGFAGQLVTGVWMGNDDYSEMDKVTGGGIPAFAWATFYKSAANIVEFPPKK